MSQVSPGDLFERGPLPYQDLASSRVAALKRLTQFQADAAHYYRAHRNEDFGPVQRRNVSLLSAAIRRRLVSEHEVLECALDRHSPLASEKFIQEVFWRGYFKGWLQQRPQIWYDYLADLNEMLSSESFVSGELGKRYQKVIAGESGIDCMDAWVQELPETAICTIMPGCGLQASGSLRSVCRAVGRMVFLSAPARRRSRVKHAVLALGGRPAHRG